MSLKISLLIPTYNRAEYLKKSLPTFFNQTLSRDNYEILVIDNNSSDNTRQVAHKLLKKFKGKKRYIFEKKQGLHYARNRGILESTAEIIVFADDDIQADKKWLKNILKEFERNKKAGVVGGKILPIWSQEPPEWLRLFCSKKICGYLTYLNYGNKRKLLKKRHVFGCSFAFRKSLAVKAGGSYPDTFPDKLRYLQGNGEIGLADKIRSFGYQIVYLPNAIVHHHIPPDRLTLEYFIDRTKRGAISDVYTKVRNNIFPSIVFNQLYTSIRKFIKVSILLILTNSKKTSYKKYLIERVGFTTKIIQLVRILFSKKLYEHIIKDNYLSEFK